MMASGTRAGSGRGFEDLFHRGTYLFKGKVTFYTTFGQALGGYFGMDRLNQFRWNIYTLPYAL